MTAGNRRGRVARVLGATALVGLGYWFGTTGRTPLAAQPAASKAPAPLPAASQPTPAKDQRIVAYIYGNTPLTREEFGDYLISRYGADRIELFVNTRIIEHACALKGIEVTKIEVDAQMLDDCKLLGISMNDFQTQVLKRYGKTMYEWKEDIIRPRILLSKLCRDRIQVSDEDLKKTYENRYGKKVKAKIIIWPKGQEHVALRLYDEIRKDDAGFDRVARQQVDAALASRAGLVEPISRWSVTGDNTVEDEAFKLQTGDVSRLIDTPVGTVVIKCLGFVEPRTDVNFEKVKPELLKEAVDKKISVEAPKLCEALKVEAAPVYVLKPARPKATDQDREVEKEVPEVIQQTGGMRKKQ